RHTLQDIERQISPDPHRNPDGTYADRTIDIDIMGIEGVTMNTPELTLPHPHLAERDFFMQPLRELQQEIAESCNDSTISTHSGH
ncbi:MAG: 2-amino-4-hydroxy-6-hydroxymethyldihydropteridine diphosphokinase, partial [Muribaculaceae bacterium]|nr:2-amino-4-hydroxy-6-hydroxymethyldihydropteridine diphosphokinase [Muribaculaceae bacterium]